jgi:LPXTG-motif cell wall-anchored protein
VNSGLQPQYDKDPSNNEAAVRITRAAADASPSPSGSSGNALGGLPVTGTPAALLAAIGVFILGSGFMMFRLARRRKLVD